MFFDPRRYDLAKVGRYKFNKKLHFKNRIAGQTLAEDVVDMSTGEILAEKGTEVDKAACNRYPERSHSHTYGFRVRERMHKVLSNMMVDLASYVDFDPEEVGVTELVYYPVLEGILAEAGCR